MCAKPAGVLWQTWTAKDKTCCGLLWWAAGHLAPTWATGDMESMDIDIHMDTGTDKIDIEEERAIHTNTEDHRAQNIHDAQQTVRLLHFRGVEVALHAWPLARGGGRGGGRTCTPAGLWGCQEGHLW